MKLEIRLVARREPWVQVWRWQGSGGSLCKLPLELTRTSFNTVEPI